MKTAIAILAFVFAASGYAQSANQGDAPAPALTPEQALQQKIEKRREEMRAEAERIRKKNEEEQNAPPPPLPAAEPPKPCLRPVSKSRAPLHLSRGSLSNGGWTIVLSSDVDVATVEARPLGHTIWTPARDYGSNTFGAAFAELPACADLEVRAETADGKTLGPFKIRFDAIASLGEQSMESLRTSPAGWVSLRRYPDENHTIVYFSALYTNRCGLREVRYSIDSEALDKRWPVPPCSLDEPFTAPADSRYDTIRLPEKHDYVAVQLVYADGTVSDVVVKRPGR
ncbi:MAG TPA: hypothetical protein VFB32_15680 [Rudaea sp.]|nr:hypothetical protein [Rudaea sp.]